MFFVKSMCNMIKEADTINAEKTPEIKETQLFGIEFGREMPFSLVQICLSIKVENQFREV